MNDEHFSFQRLKTNISFESFFPVPLLSFFWCQNQEIVFLSIDKKVLFYISVSDAEQSNIDAQEMKYCWECLRLLRSCMGLNSVSGWKSVLPELQYALDLTFEYYLWYSE